MAEHNTLTGAGLHEPLGIDTAATSDAGKVITPDSVTANTGTLRNLVESEINSKTAFITARFDDIGNISNIYIPMEFAGTVTNCRSVIDAALATADTTLQLKVNGTNMTNGLITITQSGSAAGDIDSATPTAANTLTAGQYIQVTSNTGTTGTVNVVLMFTISRT